MLDRTTPPPVYMMGSLTLPKPKVEVLPNGLVLYSLDGGTQDVNQLSFVWQGGCFEEHNPAVGHIMASMLREGTKKMSGAEISEAIDFNGAMVRALCDQHFTLFNVSALNSKMKNILPLIHDMICESTFPEQTFLTFRDIELQEYLIAQSKVSTLCSENLDRMIKGHNHPDSKYQTKEEIEAVTVEQVRNFYRRVITADGCKVFLSGRLTDDIYDAIRDMLASLPANHKAMPLDIVPYEAERPQQWLDDRRDLSFVQASVRMGIPAPSREHPDYLPLRFAVVALGGYFGSRLMKNIREDKGYTYGIGAYLLGSREGSYVLISAQTDRKYVEALIDEVKVELRRLASEPITDDEMLRLKQFISSSLMETMDSPFSIMDFYRTMECVGMPDSYFESQVDWVHRIDADTIMTMARRYLDPDALRIAIVE